MIRILHYIGSLELGGSQTFVMELYRNMDRKVIQFDFVIFSGWRGTLYNEIAKLGGKIYESPKYNGLNHLAYKRWWNKFLREHHEYSVIHGHVRSVASLYLPIMRKHKRYTIIHSHSMSNGKGVRSLIKTVLQFPIRWMADYYMACSDGAGKWLFGDEIIKSERYMTVSNAISIERFSYSIDNRARVRSEYEIDDSFVIGHVGRFVEVKNHEYLLKIVKNMSEIDSGRKYKLLLVGDGPLVGEIKRSAIEMGMSDQVIFAGNQSDVGRLYSAMDVFVFPSKWEGLGIAAIEAQVSGLPVIISENVPKCVDIGAGLIESAFLSAPDEWCDRIRRAAETMKERSSHIEDARKAGYDIKANVIVMKEFYLKIAGQNEEKKKG